jgi:hypothetical protein
MAEMGIYLLTSLLGAGALLNNRKQPRTTKESIIKTEQQPTVGTNTYNSRDYYKHRREEEKLVKKNWEDAKHPVETGVIPMYYNTLHIKDDAEKIPNSDYQDKLIYNVIKHLDPAAQKLIAEHKGSAIHDIDREVKPDWGIVMDRPRADTVASTSKPMEQIGGSLLGGKRGKEDFTHNNMVPFYKGSITQDMRLDSRAKEGKLELFTGQMKLNQPQKKECGLFFEPVSGLTNVNGQTEKRDTSRYNPNNTGKKNNETPFEKVYVGPGLNDGFTARPSGGFHDPLRIMPKGIEQLRIDPVLEKEGRIASGKSHVDKRATVAQVYRNRPELLIENKNGERNFTTVGAVKGRTLRPTIVLKDTNRKKSREHFSHAKSAGANKHRVNPGTRKSRKQNFHNTPFRNVGGGDGSKRHNDYGRSGHKNRLNNRAVTGTKSHIIGMKGESKHQKRLYDKARKTRKQHYIHHPRTYGNSGVQQPGGAPAYNPAEWAAKTTIRETTENKKHKGWLGTVAGGAAQNYNLAPARTTVRETTENNRHIGGHSGLHKKHIVYNPNDRARTTVRETTENNRHIGGAAGPKKHVVHDPNDRARTTVKETTENNQHIAGVSSQLLQNGAGYMATDYEAKNTNRQFTSDHDYTGGANANSKKTMCYDDAYNARTNVNKEVVAKGRRPMGGGPRLGHQEINVEVKKMDEDRVNQYSAMKTSAMQNMFNPEAISSMTVTSERNHLPQNDIRLDTDILEAYKRNPLTHSLQSWA